MMELKKDIYEYWTKRACGYSEYNQQEMADSRRLKWKKKMLSLLEEHFVSTDSSDIKILDAGAGPGFLTILLAEAGYCVTALDLTEEMIREARSNAGPLAGQIVWKTGDAEKLDFKDEFFDAVVTRNVTWNLPHPEDAYREWYRVLKPGGLFLNFDADWYGYLYNAEKRNGYIENRKEVEAHQEYRDYYTGTDIDRMEAIARQVPLSGARRPEWDLEAMRQAGFDRAECDREVWKEVWNGEEIANNSATPLFLLRGQKHPV